MPQMMHRSGLDSGQCPDVPLSTESAIRSLPGKGQLLSRSERSFFEPRFGVDFSGVRLHSGTQAGELANALHAKAFTVGSDIVIGTDQYFPGTSEGRKLIGHELTHVVQQGGTDAARLHKNNQTSGLSAIPTNPTHLDVQQQRIDPAICHFKASEDLSPREWRKCRSLGLIQANNEDPLRFAQGVDEGVVATPDKIRAWQQRKGLAREVAIAHLRASHEFAGSDKAREMAVISTFPIERLSVCIRPVRIADDDGKKPTILPSFDAAKAIWGKCCIDLSLKEAKTVSKTAFKTLDHGSNVATAEEENLIRAGGGGGGCISVFVTETFKKGNIISKDIEGGGVTVGTPFGPAIIVVEGVDPTVVAHELGHAMGIGAQDHGPAGTVMEVTASKHDQKESDKVATVICERVREFNGSKPGGKEECYLDVT